VDEQTFWSLVGLRQDPATVDRLTEELAGHSAADRRDFAGHLARALYALDTPAHYRAAEHSGDFLGVRCAVVAAGPATYRKVLHTPGELADFASAAGALAPILERARESVPGWATGSNTEAWGSHWLHAHLGTTTSAGGAPQAYMVALQHVVVALDADLAWQQWWRQSGVPECELGIVAEGRIDHSRPSADIRMAGDRVRANFTCAVPLTDRGPAELLPLATGEVAGIFEVIREAIGLAALPDPPDLPALPPGLHEVEVTSRPQPVIPREPQQGYLTLAQIHEFFG
jgi:hypothetical protein